MTNNINQLASQDNIEQVINRAEEASKEVKVEKGQNALRQQFEYLIKRVFGEDTSCNYSSPYNNSSVESGKRYDYGNNWNIYRSRSLFEMMTGVGRLVKISPASETESIIGDDNEYRSISITVFDPKSLSKAKIFAAAYKELSGQEAKIIQECSMPEEMNGLVEKFDEEKPRRTSKPLEVVIKFSNGTEMVASEEHWTKEFDAFIRNSFNKYTVKQGSEYLWEIDQVVSKNIFGGQTRKRVALINTTSWPGDDYWSEQSEALEIYVYDDNVTKEVLTFVKEVESQLGKPVKIIRTEAEE
ncbi:hypothetical protein HZA97_08275 [Candidatus Woesearchaeota archaeon]|nr:hypothetical protein [Candidatus Woesearchaeota archaeon]